MKNHYEFLKNHLFASMERFLSMQNTQEDETLLKAFLFNATADKGLTNGVTFAGFVPYFITAYYLPDSPYYRNDELLIRSYRGLCRYENYLHEDGSADFLCSNFHDPAMTGFHVQDIFFATELIVRFGKHTEVEDRLLEKSKEILLKMGHALTTLGFHTPNHRWVISSALAICYRYTGKQEFLDAIEGFLKEGIDCDEYGEYTERSTGSYNNICNFSFMLLGYYLDRPEFFEYPRRNLKLMYHFTEPDGTVNTLNSTRWDQGGEHTIEPYYVFYLLLALIDENPEFAYTADSILEKYGMPHPTSVAFLLTTMMCDAKLQEVCQILESKAPAKDRTVFLPNSNIARIYKPELDLTMTALASRAPVFFQMNWGNSTLQLRFAGSFFGDPHSQFRASSITPTEDGYRLVCDENCGYHSQLDEVPETSDWRKMDHSKRRTVNVQNFHTEITVHILDDGVTIDIETSGCERIPTKLEISMQPGGKLYTDSIKMMPRAGDYLFLDGDAQYFIDAFRYFEIKGGFSEHLTGNGMRGTTPVNPTKFTIALTDATPQSSTVTILAKTILK